MYSSIRNNACNPSNILSIDATVGWVSWQHWHSEEDGCWTERGGRHSVWTSRPKQLRVPDIRYHTVLHLSRLKCKNIACIALPLKTLVVCYSLSYCFMFPSQEWLNAGSSCRLRTSAKRSARSRTSSSGSSWTRTWTKFGCGWRRRRTSWSSSGGWTLAQTSRPLRCTSKSSRYWYSFKLTLSYLTLNPLSHAHGLMDAFLTIQCKCFHTGAAEGIWQTQGYCPVHQPVQCWVCAVRHRWVQRASGQTERHEQPLGQTEQLTGWLEVFVTGSPHAMSSKRLSLSLRRSLDGQVSPCCINLVHVWSVGFPWDESRFASLVGKHRPQEEWGGSHWPDPGQWYTP